MTVSVEALPATVEGMEVVDRVLAAVDVVVVPVADSAVAQAADSAEVDGAVLAAPVAVLVAPVAVLPEVDGADSAAAPVAVLEAEHRVLVADAAADLQVDRASGATGVEALAAQVVGLVPGPIAPGLEAAALVPIAERLAAPIAFQLPVQVNLTVSWACPLTASAPAARVLVPAASVVPVSVPEELVGRVSVPAASVVPVWAPAELVGLALVREVSVLTVFLLRTATTTLRTFDTILIIGGCTTAIGTPRTRAPGSRPVGARGLPGVRPPGLRWDHG